MPAELIQFVRGPMVLWLAAVAAMAFLGLILEGRKRGWVEQHFGWTLLAVGILAGSGGALLATSVVSRSADGCPRQMAVRWDPQGGHEPWPGSGLAVHVRSCTTLMVSGLAMKTPAGTCSPLAGRICVAVWHPSARSTFAELSGLVPGQSWWGVTWAGVEEAIYDKTVDPRLGWFSSANCDGGCVEATVFVFGDDSVPISEQTWRAPDASR